MHWNLHEVLQHEGLLNSDLFVKRLKHFHELVKSSQYKPLISWLNGYSKHIKNLEFCRQHHNHHLQLSSHTTVISYNHLRYYFLSSCQSKFRNKIYGKFLRKGYMMANTVGLAKMLLWEWKYGLKIETVPMSIYLLPLLL